MPKRLKHPPPTDPGALETPAPTKAFRSYMAALGRKGGRLSAVARMSKITPKQRSAIARKAARARWAAKRTKA